MRLPRTASLTHPRQAHAISAAFFLVQEAMDLYVIRGEDEDWAKLHCTVLLWTFSVESLETENSGSLKRIDRSGAVRSHLITAYRAYLAPAKFACLWEFWRRIPEVLCALDAGFAAEGTQLLPQGTVCLSAHCLHLHRASYDARYALDAWGYAWIQDSHFDGPNVGCFGSAPTSVSPGVTGGLWLENHRSRPQDVPYTAEVPTLSNHITFLRGQDVPHHVSVNGATQRLVAWNNIWSLLALLGGLLGPYSIPLKPASGQPPRRLQLESFREWFADEKARIAEAKRAGEFMPPVETLVAELVARKQEETAAAAASAAAVAAAAAGAAAAAAGPSAEAAHARLSASRRSGRNVRGSSGKEPAAASYVG